MLMLMQCSRLTCKLTLGVLQEGEGRSGQREELRASAAMAHGGAAAAAREREKGRERERRGTNGSGDGGGRAGRSWWPTRARLGCRMLPTRWPSSAGTPRRHGTGAGKGTSAGGLGRLRPVGQK